MEQLSITDHIGLPYEADQDIAEVDPEEKSSDISEPFDPNRIRVRQDPVVPYTLMERLKSNELNLAPDFQRKAGLWDDTKQSRLIESILLRIPLPVFYFDELDNFDEVPGEGHVQSSKWAVIDGVQRLTALRRFLVAKELRLQGLEFLTHLDGKSFDELPDTLQRRINEASMVAYIIEKGTPDGAKLSIFKRINTGGLTLSSQEIRHAMNPGPIREMLRTLAECEEFLKATKRSIRSDRMDDRECVARFLAFCDNGVDNYKISDLDNFINAAMKRLNRVSVAERQDLGRRFQRAMASASQCFGDWAFRRKTSNGRRSGINRALFESVAVSLDKRTDSELEQLCQKKEDLVQYYLVLTPELGSS